jgi:DNA-binding Lrp family transcriptional regulator
MLAAYYLREYPWRLINMMIEKKELQIVSAFRRNARENLTTASRKLNIPISTIYDRLRRYQGNLITKHTAILDFKQLGFAIKVLIAFKSSIQTKSQIHDFLTTHHRVNSLYRVSSATDYLVEVLFKDLGELQEFSDTIESFGVTNRQDYYIVEDIKREDFLANKESVDLIADF